MKIALCLSGQPRVVDIGFSKLRQSILQHNSDVDVLFIPGLIKKILVLIL